MKKDEKQLSFRIDEKLLKKFHVVCKYEGRSANGQLLSYVRKLVQRFEKEHGEIKPEDMEQF